MYDVIVIGAGYGGVTAAALLSRAGRRVLLIEKNNQPGGKGLTVRRRGYAYEMWGGVGVPANASRFHELVGLLGIESDVELIVPEGDSSALRYKGADGVWRSFSGPANQAEDPGALDKLRSVFGLSDDDIAAMGKLFIDVVTMDDQAIDELEDVGALGWIRSYGLPESLVSQMCCTLNLLFVAPVNRIAASEAAFTLRQLYTGGAGRYHSGGYGRVAELSAGYVVARGGRFLTGARVERILVDKGKVSGVATSDGIFRAPVVISNAGIQPTVLSLVGEEMLPASYVERVRSLEPSWGIVGARYFLDKAVLDVPMTLVFSDQSWWDDDRHAAAHRGEWPDASMVFLGVPDLWDPRAAPDRDRPEALTAALGSPDPLSPLNKVALARSEETIGEVFPEFFSHVVRREAYGAQQVSRMTRASVLPGQGGEAIGLAQVVGQCGSSKPDPRAPLPGLYFVGADAGGRGAGTHQAVDSGFRVASIVEEDWEG